MKNRRKIINATEPQNQL